MKREKLLNAIGEIDDDLIFDAVHDKKKRGNWPKWGKFAAVAVLAFCVGVGIFTANTVYSGILRLGGFGTVAADSIVLLDVNPSIAFTVDAKERIVKAEGLNEDGRLVLDGMDFTGADMTLAVNAVVGSMLQKGYLSDLQNAILVSVENEDAEKSAALQKRVSDIIGNALQEGNLDGTVLSQTLSDTGSLEQMARDYQISMGKAALIQEVMAQDKTLTAEKLAPLSITEIALISQSKSLSSGTVTQNGTASNKAYISQDAAMEIAYSHAGVNAQDVTKVKAEFDSDDGIMVYEIEFLAGNQKYECDIDARTGQIVKYEVESTGMPPAGTQQPSDAQQPSGTGQPADTQPSSQTTPPPAQTQQPSGAQQPAGQYIGEESAKEAALTHANVSADTVDYMNAWLEYDDGYPEHYEVEFFVGSMEYEYEIDMYTGAVLKCDMENKDSHHGGQRDPEHGDVPGTGSGASAGDIGAEAAKQAALSHAGLAASDIRKLEIDFDYDDGLAVYEVEFECNGYEYEYEIDAVTGAVLKYEIDD